MLKQELNEVQQLTNLTTDNDTVRENIKISKIKNKCNMKNKTHILRSF